MTKPKRAKHAPLLLVIRLMPLLTALGFIELSSLPYERVTLYLDRLLRLLVVLLMWNMAEGVFMLWIREKNAGSTSARGYGAAASILGLLVLVLLQAFRSQSTQAQFLLLLAALALRGMSRSGWEQARPHIAAFTAPIAHTLLAALSFLLILGSFSWQALIISLAVGFFTGAVETTWNAPSFRGTYPSWVLPIYRASISLPPIAVGSLSLTRQLPASYLVALALLLWSTRYTWTHSKRANIPGAQFLELATMYFAFFVLVVGALVYS